MAQNILGVDIGSSSVKAIHVKKDFLGRTSILKAHMVSIENDDPQPSVSKCLDEFSDKIDILIVSLDRINIAQKFVELPAQETEKIRKLAPFQLEGKVPFLDNALTDGCLLYSEKGNRNHTLLSALNKNDLERRKQLIENNQTTSFRIRETDYKIDSIALINLFINDESTPSEAVIVDWGYSKTVISIIDDNKLICSRIIRCGTKDSSVNDDNTHIIKLTKEIKRTILSTNLQSEKKTHVWLSGGGASDKVLVESLCKESNYTFTVFESSMDKRISTKYLTALGLAMSVAVDEPVNIDFFHKSRPHFLFNKTNLIRMTSIIIIFAAINLWTLSLQRQVLEDSLINAGKEIERQRATLKLGAIDLPEGKNIKEILALTENRITLLKRNKISTARTFNEAVKCLKDIPITLLSLEIKPNYMRMEAEAESFAVSDKLKQNLSSSPWFSDVDYENVNQSGPASKRIHRFFIRCSRTNTDMIKG
jgi:hypothetical protein